MTANDLLDRILETKRQLGQKGLHDVPLVVYIGIDHYFEVQRTLQDGRLYFKKAASTDGEQPGRDFDFCGYQGHVVSTPDYLHIAVA